MARALALAGGVWSLVGLAELGSILIHRGLNAAAPIWSGKMLHDNLAPCVCRSSTPSLLFSHLPLRWTIAWTTLHTTPTPSVRYLGNAKPMAMTQQPLKIVNLRIPWP